ncbi:YitT family protein [Aerococcaceae bacterium INB8]|uniref:YitT family protein n=1 Tax=Ruoffia halotolerans TaxID=2748684 RepID=A0A839A4M4_9LACT|nr:YitT family protein [Ruoffia halotolerans]MBA5728770.1 YitT family protein [Ruoffia halotolerans]
MYKSVIKNLALVLIGTYIFSIAVNSIVIPNQLGEGGVTGITLLLFYIFDISPALSNFIINAIIMLVGWRFLEKETIFYTIVAIISMSLFLEFIFLPSFIPTNSLLGPLASGFLIGLGIGIVILGHGTTAGVDIIALIINKYLGLQVSIALLILDVLIVIPLTIVIGLEKGLLTLISLYITSKILNFVMEGYNPKKAIMVVSNKHDEIAEEIMKRVDRGITVLKGYGYYSKAEKEVLYVVINRIQLIKVQRIINEIDSNAFVTVTGIQQVLGEGFTFNLDQSHNIEENEVI